MKYKISFLILLLRFFVINYVQAEYIFKSDGSIIQGTILNETDKEISIQPEEGSKITLIRSEYIRTLYTDDFRKFLQVRLTSGKIIMAYKVYEDREYYIFRKKLNINEEFKIKRISVQFFTGISPTDILLTAGKNEIDIKWNPPYGSGWKYNIYLKSEHGSYKYIAVTKKTDYKIEGLESKKKYFIKVSTLSPDGYESEPSEEKVIKTENIPPVKPAGIKLSSTSSDNGKIIRKLSWSPAKDCDGTVVSYNVYMEVGRGYKKIGQSGSASYLLEGIDLNEVKYFVVRAVDNDGAESENSREINTRGFARYSIDAAVYPAVIFPFGKLSNLLGIGYGLNIRGEIIGIFNRLDVGLQTGYWSFPGSTSTVDSAAMIPLTLTIKYPFFLSNHLILSPAAALGISYNSITYDKDGKKDDDLDMITERALEPILMISLRLDYILRRLYIINAGIDYGVIFENGSDRIDFIAFVFGGGCRF